MSSLSKLFIRFLLTLLMSVGNVVTVPLSLGPLYCPNFFFFLTKVLASDFSGKVRGGPPRPVSSHSLLQNVLCFSFLLPSYLKGRIVPDFSQPNSPLMWLTPNPRCQLLSPSLSGSPHPNTTLFLILPSFCIMAHTAVQATVP